MSNTNKNMSNNRHALLATVSVLALMVSSSAAIAGDDHPLVWIELGATADNLSGTGDRFLPGFTTLSSAPGPYSDASPAELQNPNKYTFGGEGHVGFQPENSDWVFSAGVKYGRSNNKRDRHHQTGLRTTFYNPYHYFYPNAPLYATKYTEAYSDVRVRQSERHLILDFQAGKDFGLGMFGHSGSSLLSAGVRVARFDSRADVKARARPEPGFYTVSYYGLTFPVTGFNNYYMTASAKRSFNGLGPEISWNASVPVAGNQQDGQLAIDWSLNGAALFGHQNAKVHHHTTAQKLDPFGSYLSRYTPLYPPRNVNQDRSRNVTVPNLGGSIGISYRMENFKMSLGYRADYFFNAMDGGIDAAKKTTLGFNGLYASVSVGLGN